MVRTDRRWVFRALASAVVAEIRDASLPADRESVAGLWLDYLSWGNDALETR
jgi:hypothetical protein